ncbi:MAG: ZIP family metal transporter [Firmicutes bacterium]|nr:ZIP family metal transporter [Bacillota bacterium]
MTNAILEVFLITFVSGVFGTGLGGVLGASFRRDSSKTVSLLLSFAAGVMLSVVCFALIGEGIAELESMGTAAVLLVILGVLAGYGMVYLLNFWIDRKTDHEVPHIDEAHPKTADSLEELIHSNHLEVHAQQKDSSSQMFLAGMIMVFAIALHHMPEGMVIGASFATEANAAASRAGLGMALIIGLHNIPEGMSVSVPLIAGGMKRWKAILLTALSGLPTVIGALLGFWLGTIGPIFLALSLSFASGAMLYVVFGELLPAAILMWRSKLPAFAVLVGMMVGLIIIFA